MKIITSTPYRAAHITAFGWRWLAIWQIGKFWKTFMVLEKFKPTHR
jgi:hypothetical protein